MIFFVFFIYFLFSLLNKHFDLNELNLVLSSITKTQSSYENTNSNISIFVIWHFDLSLTTWWIRLIKNLFGKDKTNFVFRRHLVSRYDCWRQRLTIIYVLHSAMSMTINCLYLIACLEVINNKICCFMTIDSIGSIVVSYWTID